MNTTTKKFIIITLTTSVVIAIIWLLWKKFLSKKNEINNIMSTKGGKNNPGHLIVTNTNWQGKLTPVPGQRFENFDTLENGIRAWLINARTQIIKGYNTIDSFVDRLTPAFENPEAARKGMKTEIRNLLKKETIAVSDLYKIAPIIFKYEGNPDYMTNKQYHNALAIMNVAYKYNIV